MESSACEICITAEILDDILNALYSKLIALPFTGDGTRARELNGISEILGVSLQLNNPRARISLSNMRGKVFSALGELLWYLAGSDKLNFIEYYINEYTSESPDGNYIYGAYGPRLLSSSGKYNQLDNIIHLLNENPTSKRAVIQIFESRDIARDNPDNNKSIPCTCTLQFIMRDKKLNMFVYMRSNDAYVGLPHDIFCFTMLQEIIANEIGAELGIYKHFAGSMHLYGKNIEDVKFYLGEGFHRTGNDVPIMPKGDVMDKLAKLLEIEGKLRNNVEFLIDDYGLEPYWKDLALLLKLFNVLKKQGDKAELLNIKEQISSRIYYDIATNRIGN